MGLFIRAQVIEIFRISKVESENNLKNGAYSEKPNE